METIDEYLDTIQPAQADELRRIRQVVHDTVPDVTEGIGYGMPGFKYRGKPLLAVGAFKKHMSLFPGTIKFTPESPLPEETVIDLLLNRVAEIDHG